MNIHSGVLYFKEWLHDSSISLQAKHFSICYKWLYVWKYFHTCMRIRVGTGFRSKMKSIYVIFFIVIIGTLLTSTGILHWGFLPLRKPGIPNFPFALVLRSRPYEMPLFGVSLQWRHKGCDGVSNHQPHDCLLNRLSTHRSKKTSTLRVTGLLCG